MLQKVSKPITNSGATEKQREHTNVTVPNIMSLQEQNIFEYWEENVAYPKGMKLKEEEACFLKQNRKCL